MIGFPLAGAFFWCARASVCAENRNGLTGTIRLVDHGLHDPTPGVDEPGETKERRASVGCERAISRTGEIICEIACVQLDGHLERACSRPIVFFESETRTIE